MDPNNFSFIAALILLSILALVIKKYVKDIIKNLQIKNSTKNSYLYRQKSFLMSKPEHEFFDILVRHFGSDYYIFPQVHLSTIFDHRIKGQSPQGALNHISRKSIDFVLCDKSYIRPLLGIELDDSSHKKEDRIERDKEVESIFRNSGLPLVRFQNHGYFDQQEIVSKITESLSRP